MRLKILARAWFSNSKKDDRAKIPKGIKVYCDTVIRLGKTSRIVKSQIKAQRHSDLLKMHGIFQ